MNACLRFRGTDTIGACGGVVDAIATLTLP